jgi:hypothetical protein
MLTKSKYSKTSSSLTRPSTKKYQIHHHKLNFSNKNQHVYRKRLMLKKLTE